MWNGNITQGLRCKSKGQSGSTRDKAFALSALA